MIAGPSPPVAAAAPRYNVDDGLQDVQDLVDDALKDASDTSSVSSSVINDALQDDDSPRSKNKESKVTDEMALPDPDTPVLIGHRQSDSDTYRSSEDHVTTISVGMPSPSASIERHESVERARQASLEDHTLGMNGEITIDAQAVEYVQPEQPRHRTNSTVSSDGRRSRTSSLGYDEDMVFTAEDFAVNDYRMKKLQKEEVVDFKFGTLTKNKQKDLVPREETKEEPAPVTSLRSLRQAMRRPVNVADEKPPELPSLIMADDKPMYVENVSQQEEEEEHIVEDTYMETHEAAPSLPSVPPPNQRSPSPTVEPHEHTMQSPVHRSPSPVPRSPSPVARSPSPVHRPPSVQRSPSPKREEIVIPKEEIVRPKVIQPVAHVDTQDHAQSSSFVQSALQRERNTAPIGTTQPLKRPGRTSIYDIIKADITQRKGGIYHHDGHQLSPTEHKDFGYSSSPPATSPKQETEVTPEDLQYLDGDHELKIDAKSPEGVALPRQQFYFSSTRAPDEEPELPRARKTSKLLMGPRPWGAPRDTPSMEHVDAKTDENSNYPDTLLHQDYKSEESTVAKSPSKEAVQQKCDELSFSPRPESESDIILEEKSISLMALPTKESQAYNDSLQRDDPGFPNRASDFYESTSSGELEPGKKESSKQELQVLLL